MAVRYSNGSATALDKGCNISRFHVARMAGECLHPQAPNELSENQIAKKIYPYNPQWDVEGPRYIMPNVEGPFWRQRFWQKRRSSEAKSHSLLSKISCTQNEGVVFKAVHGIG